MRHLSIGDRGQDVRQLQVALNARAKPRGLPLVVVDGEYGHETDRSLDRVTRMLGALEETIQKSGATPGQQRIVLHPATRNPKQLTRARSRAKQAAEQKRREELAHPVVHGNKVTGGRNGHARAVSAARAALNLDLAGKRPSFYSQPGKFTADHTITGEKPGERSDCSQFQIALSWSAGLPDPNGGGFDDGYTGSLANAMTEITWQQVQEGDIVIWDPYGPQGHTEIVEDKASKLTIGHGSRHVARHHLADFSYKGRPRFFRRPEHA